MEKNSSKTGRRRTLATLDRFLLAFANSKDSKLVDAQFPNMAPLVLEFGSWVNRLRGTATRLSAEEARKEELADYQRLLRAVWASPDAEQRRYWAFQLRKKVYEGVEQQLRREVPKTVRRIEKGKWERIAPWNPAWGDRVRKLPVTPFEQALNRLGDLGQRTRVCGNPECPAPFFIAARKSQRYCSEVCAGFFQQQAKREWWRRHGREWREQREKTKQRRKSNGKAKRE